MLASPGASRTLFSILLNIQDIPHGAPSFVPWPGSITEVGEPGSRSSPASQVHSHGLLFQWTPTAGSLALQSSPWPPLLPSFASFRL